MSDRWILVIAAVVGGAAGCENKAREATGSWGGTATGSGAAVSIGGSGRGVVTDAVTTPPGSLDSREVTRALDGVATTCAGSKLDCALEELALTRPVAAASPCADAFVQVRTDRPMLVDTCDVVFQLGTDVMIARDVMICPNVTLASARCDGDALVAELARPDRNEHVTVRCTLHGPRRCTRSHMAASDDDALVTFVEDVAELATAHAWDDLVARSSRDHQQSQMKTMTQDEATYVAELFMLHRDRNSISTGGDLVTSADLDRITSLEIIDVVADQGSPVPMYLGFGQASLADRSTLRVEIMITREGGKLVLTGASG